MPVFLADTSIWAWSTGLPALGEKLRRRLALEQVVTCVPVALEVLHGSRDGTEYEDDFTYLEPLDWLSLTPTASHQALQIQRALAHTTHGAHRFPAVDYLVAAIAELHGAVLWHVDRDLARLCTFTGQPQEHERLPRRAR